MSSIEPTRKRHSTLKAILLLFLAVVAGFVVGVMGDRLILLRQGRLLPRQGSAIISHRIVERMDRELGLTDRQQKQIYDILEQQRKTIDAIWSDVRPRVRSEIHEGEQEIRTVLDDKQKAKFDKLVEKWRHRVRMLTGRPVDGK